MQTNPHSELTISNESLASCHLLGDSTKGGYMSWERSSCKAGKWPQSESSGHGNRSGGEEPTMHGSARAPEPLQRLSSLGRASAHYALVIFSFKITSVALLPLQTVHGSFGPLLSEILQVFDSYKPFSLCTSVWAWQSPEDTLWCHFSPSGAICFSFLKVFFIGGTWNSLSRPSCERAQGSACPNLPILECALLCLAISLGGLRSSSGTDWVISSLAVHLYTFSSLGGSFLQQQLCRLLTGYWILSSCLKNASWTTSWILASLDKTW